jgi:hypothetical protein
MVEAKLALGQMQAEEPLRNAAELGKAALGASPEALYAVHMALAIGKHIRAVVDDAMAVAHPGKAVVRRIAIGIDGCFRADKTPDKREQRPLLDIRDDFGVNRAGAMENAKNYRLAARAPAAPASNPARAEIALVKLNGTGFYAGTNDARVDSLADGHEVTVDRHAADAGEQRRFRGIYVMRKIPDKLAKLGFGKTGAESVSVAGLHKYKVTFFSREKREIFSFAEKIPSHPPPPPRREIYFSKSGKFLQVLRIFFVPVFPFFSLRIKLIQTRPVWATFTLRISGVSDYSITARLANSQTAPATATRIPGKKGAPVRSPSRFFARLGIRYL